MITFDTSKPCGDRVKSPNTPCLHYIKPDLTGDCGFCKLPTHHHCIEAMRAGKLPMVSHTTVSDLMHCPMKVYYTQVLGIKAKDEHLPTAVKMGKCIDRFLDEYSRLDHSDIARFGIIKTVGYLAQSLGLDEASQAKVVAVMRAFVMLGIVIDKCDQTQPEIVTALRNGKLIAHLDRLYPNHMVESKFTARPETYLDAFNISHQVGTYFLSAPEAQYCIMEVIQVPQQKMTAKESVEEYEQRIYDDIMLRPGHYFKGYDATTKRFGKKFWRSEFNLADLKLQYENQLDELYWRTLNNNWSELPSRIMCDLPTPCWYKSICRTGGISDEMYELNRKQNHREE